jgi:hypothetical protein
MNKYHIRYNTKHGESNLVWRVFENGKEFLASDLRINTPVSSERTVENGVVKWNICCSGNLKIIDGVAHID